MADEELPVGAADREKILAAAKDYIESWLDGDAERMGRCLHPQLAKRSVEKDPKTGEPIVENLTREDMVGYTKQGFGKKYSRPYELTILDAYGDLATVRLFSSTYMDYLHIARFGDRWQLLNVLWQRRPGK